jgi:predicted DNA-binding protein YlxM (UPF0122 family)
MTTIQLTPQEVKELKRVKKELLTDKNATHSSQTRNHNKLAEVATKYSVDVQVIYDSIPD